MRDKDTNIHSVFFTSLFSRITRITRITRFRSITQWQPSLGRFVKFGIVGSIGTVVEYGVFIPLVELFKNTGSHLLINILFPALAFEISLSGNFLLSYFWAWKERRHNFTQQLTHYHAMHLSTFLLRLILFNTGLTFFHIGPAQNPFGYYGLFTAVLGVATILNFLILEMHIFKQRNKE